MSHPIIADNKSLKVSLAKGPEYHFCTCGPSRSQPFCDGSHADTEFTPRVIVSDADQEVYLSACKHTGNAPICDGTHAWFSDAQIGEEGPGIDQRKDEQPAVKATPEEPNVEFSHERARGGLAKVGHPVLGVRQHPNLIGHLVAQTAPDNRQFTT